MSRRTHPRPARPDDLKVWQGLRPLVDQDGGAVAGGFVRGDWLLGVRGAEAGLAVAGLAEGPGLFADYEVDRVVIAGP